MTIQEALKRIEELEKENKELRDKLEKLENRDRGGRKPHDGKWQASYDLFAELYESGASIEEISKKCNCSRRTYYRYKAYYDKLNGLKK
ncbi:MAG: helix-turn-helix domain-containing protein [Lachnospiraceae bacterium]|nr:helix-turn-helix domain-containing protein [Lachnospiraceae bacterium]